MTETAVIPTEKQIRLLLGFCYPEDLLAELDRRTAGQLTNAIRENGWSAVEWEFPSGAVHTDIYQPNREFVGPLPDVLRHCVGVERKAVEKKRFTTQGRVASNYNLKQGYSKGWRRRAILEAGGRCQSCGEQKYDGEYIIVGITDHLYPVVLCRRCFETGMKSVLHSANQPCPCI